MFAKYVAVHLHIRFPKADLTTVVSTVEQALEVRDTVLPADDLREGGYMDRVRIAQEQHAEAFLQPVDQFDAGRGDGSQHRVPTRIDPLIADIRPEELADAIPELSWRKRSGLEPIEEMVLLRLAVERIEISEAERLERPR